MNWKSKVAVVFGSIFVFMVAGSRPLFPTPPARTARNQANKKPPAPTKSNGNKPVAPAAGCSLLTPAMIEKVLGQSFQGGPPQKMPPMYGGAWGWSCQYFSRVSQDRVDFIVYAEASPAKAKQDFDTYSIAADSSKGNPSIGDSAYWVTNNKQEPLIYVLKGKVHFSLGMIPANEKQLKDLAASVAARI